LFLELLGRCAAELQHLDVSEGTIGHGCGHAPILSRGLQAVNRACKASVGPMGESPSAFVNPTEPRPTGERFVLERPEGALARGFYAVPAWSVIVLVAALALATLAYYALRLRRARRR
jgi:hypothetical protein